MFSEEAWEQAGGEVCGSEEREGEGGGSIQPAPEILSYNQRIRLGFKLPAYRIGSSIRCKYPSCEGLHLKSIFVEKYKFGILPASNLRSASSQKEDLISSNLIMPSQMEV